MDASPTPAEHPSPTILVVEDEEPIRLLVRVILEEQGHRVLSADDAGAALRMSEQLEECIDLAIVDMGLPDANGVDLVQHLRAVRPWLGIVFISGNSDAESAHGAGGLTNASFL